MSSTATAGFTLKDLERAAALIKSIPVSSDWVLASPDGRVWKGNPVDLFPVLAQHHPLLKMPTLGELLKEPMP